MHRLPIAYRQRSLSRRNTDTDEIDIQLIMAHVTRCRDF
jgi:hypothetical protein